MNANPMIEPDDRELEKTLRSKIKSDFALAAAYALGRLDHASGINELSDPSVLLHLRSEESLHRLQ